ncbi:release factor glutamine methyltransferase [Methanococcoides vulcani]|uniref:Release factor glutamine methyltransferase n=1 Tax=Methanococcoides vulcani TaxID=1353158 RepID=A0A1I0BMA0_9EURY|nr:HemK2/MTQ2 family protein methyltransferase [Methanococcoides vulcani]SET08092.1 release factor glutamine methyltransferase [Methanococcoides vulcani]
MVTITYRNANINLDEQVYDPAEDSYLLADVAIDNAKEGMKVLEVGAGTGFVSAVLQENVDVDLIATEISPIAATCARASGVEVIRTDMFTCFKHGTMFDLILFNPPYLPTSEDEKVPGWLNYAFDGGPDGRDAVNRFIDEVPEYLNNNGMVLILISSLTGIEQVKERMKACGFKVETCDSDNCFFEELIVVKGTFRESEL